MGLWKVFKTCLIGTPSFEEDFKVGCCPTEWDVLKVIYADLATLLVVVAACITSSTDHLHSDQDHTPRAVLVQLQFSRIFHCDAPDRFNILVYFQLFNLKSWC